jgi:UDP-N-acetylglucosamine 2-epimerase (non-hydrolysing)
MAPLVRLLARDARFESRLCVTGQHRQMLDQALALFELVPDHDLDVMSAGQDLFDVTARVLLGMRGVLRAERPDVVLVHGDTTSCFAAALAAFYERIEVAHVEAGLRSGDLDAPFPEELNRVVADRVTRWHFAPTELARRNLLAEGRDPSRIAVTGNTVIDALLWTRGRVAGRRATDFAQALGERAAERIDGWRGRIVLVTGHRRESFGRPFEELCSAIAACARRHQDWLFVYPVHPNPNVQQPARRLLGASSNVLLAPPLEYEPFVWLMDRCDLVLTDSGGVQEEAPALGKPVLVTREVTERPEAIEAGTARLVGTDASRITRALEELLGDPRAYAAMAGASNPYGDGRASERIADVLARRAAQRPRPLAASA